MRRLGALLASMGAVVLFAAAVRAQDASPPPAPDARDRELEEMRRRLEALEARMAATPTGTATLPTTGSSATEAAPAAAAPPERPWYEQIHVHGWVDVYGDYNPNMPRHSDATGNFFPGVGTSAKQPNQVDLNVAALDVSVDPQPVGFHLTLNYGTSSHVLHGGEPDIEHRRFLEMFYQASVAYNAPLGSGLLLEAGVFPSHIGWEAFYSKDNWSYTRGYEADLTPYYETGVKASYCLTENLTARVFLLDGWQLIVDNNDSLAYGTQLAFASEKFDLTFNTFAGPELANDNHDWRLFAEIVPVLRPTKWLSLGAQLDLGYQEEPKNVRDALWHSYTGFVRVAPLDWLAFAVRGEIFRDPDDGISGARQTLAEGTFTVELIPANHLDVKLEVRYDHSTANVFATKHTASDGTGPRDNDQLLFVTGIVVYF